MGEKVT